ncbi:heterokaryon incompatibility protein-domain-containing protein [Xylariaceae sp. FL0016]|nr:heterokaryon incompatibility protein-domain-containing protein [Xylariaceae sp. FL0016]
MSRSFSLEQTHTLYPKLPGQSRIIRIITLSPARWPQQLRCNLEEVDLEKDERPYKALSYAWNNGNESATATIQCNGSAISISINLYSALVRIRSNKEPVRVWVDSLCINQKDASERTHQVGMMREIYQRSSEVVIWLGDSRSNDNLGHWLLPIYKKASRAGPLADENTLFEWYGDERDYLKVLAYLSPAANRLRATHSIANDKTRDVFGAFCILHALCTGVPASNILALRNVYVAGPIIRGFAALVEKSWWRRVWVVQEVVVARKATIYFGKLSAPWKLFSEAAVQFERSCRDTNVDSMYPYLTEGEALTQFSRLVADIESTRKEWELAEPIVLLPLIRKFRSREASDDRDKVFALLGLVRFWGRGKPISPNYSLDVSRTFFETTKMLICSIRSLSVLAGTVRQANVKRKKTPSWVIDWSCLPDSNEHVRLSCIPLYDASKHLHGSVRLHGHGALETPAYHIDKVELVGLEMEPAAARRMRLIVWGWWKLAREAQQKPGRYTPFWRTLCADVEYLGSPAAAGADFGTGPSKPQFRRATAASAETWDQWKLADRTSWRTTSIVAGYWQERRAPEKDDDDDNDNNDHNGTKARNAFHHTLECTSWSRRFFVTESGYMGMGPQDVRAGDDVFVLCGSQVPFVLRRTSSGAVVCRGELFSNTEQTYFPAGRGARIQGAATATMCEDVHRECYGVVGDAYVHGIMDGEGAKDPATGLGREARSIILI